MAFAVNSLYLQGVNCQLTYPIDMKQTLKTKFFNYILVLLGFATTTSCEYIPQVLAEYGTPTMDFEVSGKVVNQDSAPIAGIKVSCRVFYDPGVATVLTSEDGSFNISGTAMRPLLEFEDIDGPENGGEYVSRKEEIKVDQVGKGDGHWYMGKYESKGVVIKMEKK